jgi:hypothetical protein
MDVRLMHLAPATEVVAGIRAEPDQTAPVAVSQRRTVITTPLGIRCRTGSEFPSKCVPTGFLLATVFRDQNTTAK